MTEWFGQPWPDADYRAPVCDDDALHVATPVGVPCRCCDEPITEGDQGIVITGSHWADGRIETLPAHLECTLREVLGCYGNLTGAEHSHDGSLREDARRVAAWVDEHGMRR